MASTITAAQANLATYVCSGLAAAILIARLASCRLNSKPFDSSFTVTLLTLLLVLGRVIVTYFVLDYGTAADILTTSSTPSASQLSQVKIGSILSLVLRLLLTAILWLLNLLLLNLYSRFISHLPWMRLAIRCLTAFIALSFLAVLLTTLLECRPLSQIYQVLPPPGTCVKAYAQISLQCACNALIDASLMLISLPVLFIHTANPTRHRARMALLISLGLFCITVTALRWGYTFRAKSFQPARTFWASINVLVATFVANAPVLYGAARLVVLGRRDKATGASSGPRSRTGVRGPGGGSVTAQAGKSQVTTVVEAVGPVRVGSRAQHGPRRWRYVGGGEYAVGADDEEEVGIVREMTVTVEQAPEEQGRDCGNAEGTGLGLTGEDEKAALQQHRRGAVVAPAETWQDKDEGQTEGIEHLPPVKPA